MNINALPQFKFQVEENNDIFNTKLKIENDKNRNPCFRIARNILSVMTFPVGLTLFAAKKIAPLIILPAANLFNFKNLKTQHEMLTAKKIKLTDEKTFLSPEKNEKEIKKINSKLESLEDSLKDILSLDQSREKFLAENSHAKQITIRTADDVDLDAFAIMNKAQDILPVNEQKWMIFLNPNASCYERNLNELTLLSEHTGASLLTSNYRGVMRSQGSATSSHDLVLDGEAFVQYLLSRGIPSHNILIHGFSLGGAVATEVVANHQIEGQEMHLCNDRSFSTITDVLKAWTSNIIGTIVGKTVFAAGWQFDGVKNFQKIKGYKFTIHCKGDGVIRYKASLYKCLKKLQMAPMDRILKKQRAFQLKHGIDKHDILNKNYKPKNAIKIPIPSSLSLEQAIGKYGTMAHCYPLTQLDGVFTQYIKQVKEALRITL